MRPIEESVLKTYTDVSPSKTPADTDQEWGDLVERRSRITHDRLLLLPEAFQGKRLLDLGCGTGENTAFYASLGAMTTGVDFNPVSLERLQRLFETRGLSDRLEGVVETAVSAWEPPPEGFDICVSHGVIHHLSNLREGFTKLASALRPGGILIISVGTENGSFQREIMKQIVNRFADGLEESIEIALALFPEYMERAVRLGKRTAEQVVNDNFITAQDERIPVATILAWFREQNLRLFRTWPVLEPAFADSASAPLVDWTEPDAAAYLDRRSRSWRYAKESVQVLVDAGLSESDLAAREVIWREEIGAIEAALEKGDLDALKRLLPTCRLFGRGYCGTGDSYYVGIKKSGPGRAGPR